MISWDFFRLTAPRFPGMAVDAVSLRKSHDIVILSFCNIVKGQANSIHIYFCDNFGSPMNFALCHYISSYQQLHHFCTCKLFIYTYMYVLPSMFCSRIQKSSIMTPATYLFKQSFWSITEHRNATFNLFHTFLAIMQFQSNYNYMMTLLIG